MATQQPIPDTRPRMLVRRAEAARILGITTSGLCKWDREGKGPRCIRADADGRPYYLLSEIEDWIDRQVARRDGKAA